MLMVLQQFFASSLTLKEQVGLLLISFKLMFYVKTLTGILGTLLT